MGEGLTKRVRIEDSYRALRGLRGQIMAWADRRHRQDVLDQYRAHVSVVEDLLLEVLDDLAAALDGIDGGRPVGEVYWECRRADDRLGLVGQLWVWLRAIFDQRDDPVFGPLLAAADEIAWSCYAAVFGHAAALSGREVPRGLVPLPYIEFRSVHATGPGPAGWDLRPSRDDDIVRQLEEKLPFPVIGLPLAYTEAPWWLLLLSHEVGHQIQSDLVPKYGLVREFRELVEAAAGGADRRVRWGAWSQEIFADLCLLCTGGPWGIWSMVEQVLAPEGDMLTGLHSFPPSVARLELLATAATELGVDGHAGLRGVDPRRLATDAGGAAALDVAVAPWIAAQAVSHRLGGLGTFAELFAFDPSDFRPGGSVHQWARALRAPGSLVRKSSVPSSRLIACGAVAAWSEVAAIADAAEREDARAMLREALLHELIQDREAVEGATRAVEPSAVPNPSSLVTELRQLVLARFAQMEGKLDRIETGVGEIAKVTEIVQGQLRRWTVSYETTSGTPRLFTLTPVRKHGLDKAAVWRDTYQLTLWCEHGDRPHPWGPAHYTFSKPREWLITVAPYALGVLQILRLAVNVAAPIAILGNVDLASIKDDLDAMDKLLDQLPAQLPDAPAAPGQPVRLIQPDGPELRALRALLTELDPNRTFNGMHVVPTPSGDIRWVCQDHYTAYNLQSRSSNG